MADTSAPPNAVIGKANNAASPAFVAYWYDNGQTWISARVGCDAFDPTATINAELLDCR